MIAPSSSAVKTKRSFSAVPPRRSQHKLPDQRAFFLALGRGKGRGEEVNDLRFPPFVSCQKLHDFLPVE
jgi:hypothetical protein